MTPYEAAIRSMAFSALMLAIPVNSAWAQDASAVAERLKALTAQQGLDVTWTGISGDASNMVLEDVSVAVTGEQTRLPIGNVTLTGVTLSNGRFVVDTLATPPLSTDRGAMSVAASPLVVRGLELAASDTGPLASIAAYESATIDSLTVAMDGRTAFALTGFAASATSPNGGQPMQFAATVERFSTDLTLIKDPSVMDYFEALRYSRIEGSMEARGTWQPADGRWIMSRYDLAMDDIGTFGMTMDLGGLTPELIQTANEASTQIARNESDVMTAEQTAFIGMLSSVTFYGATLKFTDGSLTERAVDLIAKRQRANPADVVATAKAALPFALLQMGMTDLAGALAPPIGAFLDNPESIEIVAAPPEPVTFGRIGEVAMATPSNSAATTQALWSLLGATLTANE